MKKLPRGVYGKRRRLLAMKRAQAGKVLRPGFFQLNVVADDADDIRLLLDRVREIAGIGHVRKLHCSEGIVGHGSADWNICERDCCGEVVGNEG
jgi:hypothetical protein